MIKTICVIGFGQEHRDSKLIKAIESLKSGKADIPDHWKNVVFVKLTRKKKMPRAYDNWKSIMLLSLPSKIMSKTILKR
jgi:hypothetical protein